MLSWKTNLILLVLGLIYPIAMSRLRNHKKKEGDDADTQFQPGKEKEQ
jgi:hypothetical protein